MLRMSGCSRLTGVSGDGGGHAGRVTLPGGCHTPLAHPRHSPCLRGRVCEARLGGTPRPTMAAIPAARFFGGGLIVAAGFGTIYAVLK